MSETISSSGFSVTYDRASDVLYVSKRPGAEARSREEEPGMVWRYDAKRGDLIGATIIDFVLYWLPRRDVLAEEFARRFVMSRQEAQNMLDRVDQ